jgi:hypothetical protein
MLVFSLPVQNPGRLHSAASGLRTHACCHVLVAQMSCESRQNSAARPYCARACARRAWSPSSWSAAAHSGSRGVGAARAGSKIRAE